MNPQRLEEYGAELRAYREKFGLTRTDLADVLQISVSTISNIESGHAPPSTATMLKLDNYRR